jgi:ATP-dependent RNA helicase DDX18/HAS1
MSLNVSKKVFKRRLQKFKRTPDNKKAKIEEEERIWNSNDNQQQSLHEDAVQPDADRSSSQEQLSSNVNEIAVDASASIKSAVLTDTVFDTLKGRISEATLKSVAKMGFNRMTHIQSKVIEPLLEVYYPNV